jgi:hypothetical protein
MARERLDHSDKRSGGTRMTGVSRIGESWIAFFRDIHLGYFRTRKDAQNAVKEAQRAADIYVEVKS